MELYNVSIEAHPHAATLYIAGVLSTCAAARASDILRAVPERIVVVRLDLRAVQVIDPVAFLTVARALDRWRDVVRGRVTIEFPARAQRPRSARVRLLDPPGRSGLINRAGAASPHPEA